MFTKISILLNYQPIILLSNTACQPIVQCLRMWIDLPPLFQSPKGVKKPDLNVNKRLDTSSQTENGTVKMRVVYICI